MSPNWEPQELETKSSGNALKELASLLLLRFRTISKQKLRGSLHCWTKRPLTKSLKLIQLWSQFWGQVFLSTMECREYSQSQSQVSLGQWETKKHLKPWSATLLFPMSREKQSSLLILCWQLGEALLKLSNKSKSKDQLKLLWPQLLPLSTELRE